MLDMSYYSQDPFRHGRTTSSAFDLNTFAANAPRPEYSREATGPRLVVSDGAAGIGSYFSLGERPVHRGEVWDEPMETVPGLRGLGALGLPSVPSLPSSVSQAASAVGVDPNAIAQDVSNAVRQQIEGLVPQIKTAATNAVNAGVSAAMPAIQAKIKPIEQKIVTAYGVLAVLSAATLLGVGYLAYKQKGR